MSSSVASMQCAHRHRLFLCQRLWACYCLPLPPPVFWPGEFHGLYGPWGGKESDTTEQLSLSPPPTPACRLSLSPKRLFVTPWTAALHGPLSAGFSRPEYWSGLPCSPPGDLPNPGIELTSLVSPALAGRFFTTSATWEASGTGTHHSPFCLCDFDSSRDLM